MAGSGKYCEKHNTEMILTPVGPSCMDCTREKVEEEDRKLSRDGALRHHLSQTYHVLKKKSVFSDETIVDASFDAYEVKCKEQHDNREKVKQLGKAIMSGKPVNVWLVGKAGRGKSHLAMSLVNALNDYGRQQVIKAFENEQDPSGTGYSCLFMSFDKMLNNIRSSINSKDTPYLEQHYIDLCNSADVLVIDDLGAESGAIEEDDRANKFVHRVLYAIANGRMGKTTIITTNLRSEQRAKLYDEKTLSRLYMKKAELTFIDSPDMRATEFEW